MQRHLVFLVVVDSLHDIDLSTIRPVVSHCPECRPCSAPVGHVCSIEDEYLSLLEGGIGGYSDRVPIRALCQPVCVIDLHNAGRAGLS